MAKGLKGLLNFITGHVNPNAVESSYLRDPTLKTREDLGREMIDPTSQYYRQQRDLNMQDAMDMGASQSFLGTRNAMRMGGSQAIAGQVGQAGTRNMVQDALRSSSQEFGRGQAMGAGLLSGVSGQYQRAGAARANQMIDNAANKGAFAQSMIGLAGGMVGDYFGAKWQGKFNPRAGAGNVDPLSLGGAVKQGITSGVKQAATSATSNAVTNMIAPPSPPPRPTMAIQDEAVEMAPDQDMTAFNNQMANDTSMYMPIRYNPQNVPAIPHSAIQTGPSNLLNNWNDPFNSMQSTVQDNTYYNPYSSNYYDPRNER